MLHVERQLNSENIAARQTLLATAQSKFLNTDSVNQEAKGMSVKQVLLATAIIRVRNGNGGETLCRALLDSGSQASFISESCIQKLGLGRSSINTTIIGIAQSGCEQARGSACLTLSSITTDFSIGITALIMNKLTTVIPNNPIDVRNWRGLMNLRLADPSFFQPAEIDILLGADVFTDLLIDGKIPATQETPAAYNTQLGWVLSGRVNDVKEPRVLVHWCQVDIQEQLCRFWELEEVNIKPSHTKEEGECEAHFVATHHRDESGRYVVALPMKKDSQILGRSRDQAVKRLISVEKRLARSEQHQLGYNKFLQEYLELGHMELVPQNQYGNEDAVYLPHHFVLKEDSTTTSLRVVFDASAKTSTGTSLNDKLMVGPKLQDDIWDIIMRFRLHRYAFTADIEKMYRQIKVVKQDTDLQRILWRPTTSMEFNEYRLKTVTYGTASAPYLAIRTLHQLAEDEGVHFPLAKEVVHRDFYVDDLISGTDSIEEGLEVQAQLRSMLSHGGFHLRKWTSNAPVLLECLPEEEIATTLSFSVNSEVTVKTLGLHWHPEADYFSYLVELTDTKHWTKRKILSEVSRLYDPLGWLSPVIISSKMFVQKLWMAGVSWDEGLPSKLELSWVKLRSGLHALHKLQIDRWVKMTTQATCQLHGFCDASENAFAAVVYLRCQSPNGSSSAHLLCAKTRVAPVKQVTLPRLELCGAVLLARLLKRVLDVISLKIDSVHAWTDSTITLGWIHGFPRQWKTFVANRVSEIQEIIPPSCWRHVPSQANPADAASRGMPPQELLHHDLWWGGPPWLTKQIEHWPRIDVNHNNSVSEEQRTTKTVLVAIVPQWELVQQYSSLSKLKRVTAYCRRFINNCRCSKEDRVNLGYLTCAELNEALMIIIRSVQAQEFKDVLAGKSSNSHIQSLTPFVDKDGIIRVGGRIRNSRLGYNQKFPILLPKTHYLTDLIVKHVHVTHLHAGPQTTLNIIQQSFWVVNGRNITRRLIFKCHKCFRDRATGLQQQMGDLPMHRLEPVRAFLRCGVDFAGPVSIKSSKLRNSRLLKAYIALFVCFSTKAIHLEIVSDLSSAAFIAALRRFIARRGKCADIYCDNASNFIGARKELKELCLLVNSGSHNSKVGEFLSTEGINWHFIPARAPHFGGLWEAGVKSVKTHLRRIVGGTGLTFEELYTVITQVEACLNSRPLSPMSSDPNDLTVLTPGHFLIGEPLTAVPEPSLTQLHGNRLSRWQLLQKLVQHLWKRWQSEYIVSLQQRPKWKAEKRNIKVGDLVLVKEDNLAPCQWSKGRVVETFVGSDNLVRVASVRTLSGTYKRPVVKLCLLPL